MMKKITTIFSMLLFVAINAQVYYSEDFTSSTTGSAPTGVTVLNQDACTVNAPQLYTNGTFITLEDGGNKFAQAQSWTVPPCQVNNWLITPTINLSTASASVGLKWRFRTNAAFSETYEVRVSTTGATPADFTTLLQTYTVAAGAFTPNSLNLAAFAGQTIRIAFRQTSTDQDVLAIDDIEVSEPPQYDLAISGITTNATTYTTNLTQNPLPVRVLDFSRRTNFQSSIQVLNSGTNSVDSIILTYFLVDDLNAPTEGVIFVDTILTTLAPGATYNHTFEAFGIDTLFPGLLTNQILDFYVQIDSSFSNRTLDDEDFLYSFLVAPTEVYTAPFTNSFEVAIGTNFNFDHKEWGWKYLDNNNDGNTFAPGSFTNLPAQDGSWQIIGSIIGGNNLSLGANNDFLQSPEFSLQAGRTYEASIWARTGFGVTGTVLTFLRNATGTVNTNLGPIALTAADSTYTKYTFTFTPPATASNYMFEFRKLSNGFVMLDLFDLTLLPLSCADSPITATASTTANFCGNSNGSIDLTPSGGFGTLQYLWSNGPITQDISNLATGPYSVTITDSLNCTATFNYNVVANNYTLNTSVSTTPATTCSPSNGSATASVSNGVGTINYSWSPAVSGATISNLAPGSYTVTTSDANGCSGTALGVVADNTYALNVTINTTDVTDCVAPNGTAIVTSITGGIGTLSYAWPNNQSGVSISNVSAGPISVTVTDANGCTGIGSGTIANTAGVNASFTRTNVSCNGGNNGSISVSVTGGTAPITYEWSNQPGVQTAIASKNDLTAGSYSVIVRDANSCQVVLGPISITQPNALAISSSNVSNITCNGLNNGSINLTVSGGTMPYSLSWSNTTQTTSSITNLQPGSYSLTVTDFNNCTFTSPVYTITQPNALVVTPTLTNPLCNNDSNGSVSLLATGGTTPYQYNNGGANQASNSFTGLAGGNFTYNVVDANGCTATTGQVTLTNPDLITATLEDVNNVSCFGANDGSIDLAVSGGTGAYSYTPAITDLAPGAYSTVISDENGCTNSSIVNIEITQPTAIQLFFEAYNASSANSNDGRIEAAANGSEPPFTYNWTPGNLTTGNIDNLAPGTYSLTVTDNTGCQLTQIVTVSFNTSIQNLNIENLIMYPVPAVNEVTIEFSTNEKLISMEVMDSKGSMVLSKKVTVENNTFNTTVNVSNLATGVYYVRLKGNSNSSVIPFNVIK